MTALSNRSTLVPAGTPDQVAERAGHETRAPATDPALGIALEPSPMRAAAHPAAAGTLPRNRLVVIGDSLSQGVQSGAAFNTDLSYGAIIAGELGPETPYRHPHYAGFGGLPLNIEMLLRALERSFGRSLDLWELPEALLTVRAWMDQLEDYWERGPGAVPPTTGSYHHALAMYGWDLGDVLHHTADTCAQALRTPQDDLLDQLVGSHRARAALGVYPGWSAEVRQLTLVDAARRLGEEAEPGEDGIETLVVFVGANNCLGSITKLRVTWTGERGERRNGLRATVSDPQHFAAEHAELVRQVSQVRARHVIWCTVPHVTIAPLARGLGPKVRPGSRYFPYYTRPWIQPQRFDPRRDPHLTDAEARAVDAAVDLYNTTIEDAVREGRRQNKDWYLCDSAGLLDRLAARRYVEDPQAAPGWWTPYELPVELQGLTPAFSSHFLTGDGRGGRATGGLFSLDGLHPTTVGYGLLARELMRVMARAGVTFTTAGGGTRTGPVEVDFARLVRRDTLLTHPPQLVTSTLNTLGWADEVIDLFRRCLP